jgi:hypothetical protein
MALLPFRRQQTGVQFSQKEQEQYDKMFPSNGNIKAVNDAIISSLLTAQKDRVELVESNVLGSSWKDESKQFSGSTVSDKTTSGKTTTGTTSSGLKYTITY